MISLLDQVEGCKGVQQDRPPEKIRILQFNMLADGLSGLRPDLGEFSRITADILAFDFRKSKLLQHILDHDPDIVTLEECDHFDDYFQPELLTRGYYGMFCPKPNSPCLEYSSKGDGCAVFWKISKLHVNSWKFMNYYHQNQVAILLLFDFVGDKNPSSLLLAATHLKATKSEKGEYIRCKETAELLEEIDNLRKSVGESNSGRYPAVVIAGDLNTTPTDLVYPMIKSHPLQFRSVLNDDLQPLRPGSEIWTSWKARRRANGQESIAKSCIDYIFYSPPLTPSLPLPPPPSSSSTVSHYTLRAAAVLDLLGEDIVGEALLPNAAFPSDHIVLVADLILEQPCTAPPLNEL